MACKGPSSLRSEIQQEIKKQGEIIRQLKLEEQTDEVKNKVTFCGFPFSVISISSIKPVCKNTWALKHNFFSFFSTIFSRALCSPPLVITKIKSFLPNFKSQKCSVVTVGFYFQTL